MSQPIKGAYWSFYLEGRRERLLRNDVDVDKILKDMRDGKGSLRDTLHTACLAAAAPMAAGKIKRVWLAEHDEDIGKAGGDTDLAFQAWCTGRVDELAYVLEADLIDALADDEGEGDEEDGDDEEEEDD